MSVYWVDPIRDQRWGELVQRHPAASVFHTPGWLQALGCTYGYRPAVLTTAAPGRELTNGIPFCRVDSWLTGRRLVSLPFSDHCEPLADDPQDLLELLDYLRRALTAEKWNYIELRPLQDASKLRELTTFKPSQSFCFHDMDLRPSLDELWNRLHKDCVQRKIRRAERDGLREESGRSEPLLDKFYHLQLKSRSRQQLPPQPFAWFKNLADSLGENLTIRVASKEDCPVAAILTLKWKNKVVYKYGCSDERFRSHGGMQLLFWNMIQEAKSCGCERLDLGRSDCDNPGLIAFKDRWGATKTTLTYLRYPEYVSRDTHNWRTGIARKVVAHLPDVPLSLAAKFLYRHLG